MLRISNVKIPVGKKDYAERVSAICNISKKRIKNIQLVKQSIDARHHDVHFICSFDFETDNEEQLINTVKKYPLRLVEPYHYDYPQKNDQKVVVVGSGPAGLFCTYVLSKIHQDVVMIERGQDVETRTKDVEYFKETGKLNLKSHILFGEGGAGTFSDGKLTTGIKNSRIPYVLDTFIQHGAPSDIRYLAMPHIGTDYLKKVVKNMREDIIAEGGKVLFDTQMIAFKEDKGHKYVEILKNGKKELIETDVLVLAIGHSARDTYEMLSKTSLHLEPKPFAVGVRIEQLQETINKTQYGRFASHTDLKAAPYKLAVQTKEKRGVYTFCMCPGGEVVPASSEEGMLCVNGMSEYARSKVNANSAVLVTIDPQDFGHEGVLGGIAFQRELEKKAYALGGGDYKAPVQRVYDYYENLATTQLGKVLPSYKPGYTLSNLNQIFPDFINRNLKEGLQIMEKRLKGFIDEDTIITGVEARSSAPLRIVRNQEMLSSVDWIYPIGEGAGYAGGIMSAAIDGIMCAEAILKKTSL